MITVKPILTYGLKFYAWMTSWICTFRQLLISGDTKTWFLVIAFLMVTNLVAAYFNTKYKSKMIYLTWFAAQVFLGFVVFL